MSRFDAVYFDCDSTLVAIEGIDDLARTAPDAVRTRVVEATRRAMDGEVPLERVFAERLQALRPTRAELEALGGRYVETLVQGTREVVDSLRRDGIRTGIVSGGLRPAVMVVAATLGIPDEHVHAVDVEFARDGTFVRHVDGPLARSGGKIVVLRGIRTELGGGRLAFVGDGMTDLEAAAEVDRFVGFGGVARRAQVATGCGRWYLDGPGLDGLPALLARPDA